MANIAPIKRALGIGGISSNQSAWCSPAEDDEKGMQIDLIIERKDRVVNVCEMKFYNAEFEVTADYEMKLRNRLNRVMGKVSKKQSVQLTLVTTFGLKYGIHSGVFANVVTMDDLFRE